jgi:hypothetical protein
MTTRRALLISNPGEDGAENYCKGVYVDVENYRTLLQSPLGGAWKNYEIEHLDRPSVQDVRDAIKQYSSHDYMFVMFSGHGWYSSTDKDRILELRENEEIGSLELYQGAAKGTIILDCCQEVYPESARTKLANFALESKQLGLSLDEEQCRKLFLQQINDAPIGIVKMMSCSMTETATDDDERGGRYNASIIEYCAEWADGTVKYIGGALSVVAAHDEAEKETIRLSAGKQNPRIEKPRSGPYFPMAVYAGR